MLTKTTLSFQFNSLKMWKTVLISATAKLKQNWGFQLPVHSVNIQPSLPVKTILQAVQKRALINSKDRALSQQSFPVSLLKQNARRLMTN
jgi:hypothetical protein